MDTNFEQPKFLATAPESVIDTRLLMRILKKRRSLWTILVVTLGAFSLAMAFFVYPQSYVATVSMSMQQSTAAPSALMALTGGGSKKYIGVLKSRRFTEAVDRTVHFREVLGYPDTPKGQEDAIDKVIKDLKVEDNATDGLLYVTVSLNGPSLLWPDPGNSRGKTLRSAAAEAANGYAAALKDYLKNTDTDKELTLLRAADSQVDQAQRNYAQSIEALGAFIKNSRVAGVPGVAAAPSATSAGVSSSDALLSASQLSSLYARKVELEARLKSTDALTAGTKGLLTSPDRDVVAIPDEDPLLNNARRQVNDAANALESLQITFGSSMQSVQRAKEKLRIAQEQMHREVQAILHGNTTEQLRRQALQAEADTINRQISIAERNFQSNRSMSVDMEKRRNDVLLKFETLKAILTRYAELKIQTVSAQNRLVVIDDARPPTKSKPGLTVLGITSIVAPVVLIGLWWLIEYLLSAQPKLARGEQ